MRDDVFQNMIIHNVPATNIKYIRFGDLKPEPDVCF